MIFGRLWNISGVVFQLKKPLILKSVGQKTSLEEGREENVFNT